MFTAAALLRSLSASASVVRFLMLAASVVMPAVASDLALPSALSVQMAAPELFLLPARSPASAAAPTRLLRSVSLPKAVPVLAFTCAAMAMVAALNAAAESPPAPATISEMSLRILAMAAAVVARATSWVGSKVATSIPPRPSLVSTDWNSASLSPLTARIVVKGDTTRLPASARYWPFGTFIVLLS